MTRIAHTSLDSETGYACVIRAGRHQLTADESTAHGGTDTGPAPYQLLLSALAACTAITLRMVAARKGWELAVHAAYWKYAVWRRLAGEARGSEPGERVPAKTDAVRERAPAEETRERASQLALTHHLVTKYAGLIAIERTPVRAADRDSGAPRPNQANRGNAIPRNLE